MSFSTDAGVSVRVVRDLDECRVLWNRWMPAESMTDLWDYRACFQRHFARPAHFLSIDDGCGQYGLLPLSRLEESETYGYFPGEDPPGGAWIEQSRIPASSAAIVAHLIDRVPTPCRIRYLVPHEFMRAHGAADETGYVFVPEQYGFRFDSYTDVFSRTSRRRMDAALAVLGRPGMRYRYNVRADVDTLIRMNEARFGAASYFADIRFRRALLDVVDFLDARGMLRITTVHIGGAVAAVDLGCLYLGTYTLLAGGTHADFPGVAKLINLHHIEWACQERIACVDFLSSDFFWKKQFHLTPRPLYQYARA